MKGHKSGKYTGLFQSIRVIVREEGFSAFWKGFTFWYSIKIIHCNLIQDTYQLKDFQPFMVHFLL